MTDIQTQYGVIHDGGSCCDDYDNINIYQQTDSRIVKLQGPALRAFKAAEQRITPKRMKVRGKTRHILITGIGWRDCALQRQLWLSDPGRYANPDGSKHCRGLAIDVDQGQRWTGRTTAGTLAAIKKALLLEGWHYAVPGEPWHTSYVVSG
jgi:hypothetical protein